MQTEHSDELLKKKLNIEKEYLHKNQIMKSVRAKL
jgi:hypothetical protein